MVKADGQQGLDGAMSAYIAERASRISTMVNKGKPEAAGAALLPSRAGTDLALRSYINDFNHLNCEQVDTTSLRI